FAVLKPGDEFQECPVCPRMVVVRTGSFMMGSSDGNQDERPVRKVTIKRAFAAGKFEVTVAEYEACVKNGACDEPQWRQRSSYYNIKTGSNDHYKRMRSALTDPRHPIVGVSWINARQLVDWVNEKVGGASYRLLAEAEWEYLARAGKGQRNYGWGDRFKPDYANSAVKSARDRWAFTSPVGSFPRNPYGLHDLHGNVWEWVQDCYTPSYMGAPSNGTARQTEECNRRVVRGGSWYYVPRLLRSADRYELSLVKRRNDIGFRVGRTLIAQD
ncbi:MAG: formylglycine-generating enzyme family protein, partial [Hyphomicrobiaceae bacterium]